MTPSQDYRALIERESFMDELVLLIETARRNSLERGWDDLANGLEDTLSDAEMYYAEAAEDYEIKVGSMIDRWSRESAEQEARKVLDAAKRARRASREVA